MKLITMLLMLGTIQISAADGGIVSSDNLQQKTVSGRITDANGANLAGVNIIEKGTTNGAISTVDGKYSITVASANSILTFSFIGYLTKDVVVGSQATVDVTLTESVSTLQEIVVVGYGTRLREELTGSVSTVSADQMTVSAAPTAIGRLQGQISGVTITEANTPGGSARIRIRGLGTINNADPLYVVDGVPADAGNSVNPNDIESISVLKDASSTAIYGSRGANGVVLVTTKRGKIGAKPMVSFNARAGISQATNKYDLLNTKEYGELLWLQAKNRGVAPSNALYGDGPTPVIPDYILPAGASEGDASVNPDLYSYPNYTIIKANKAGTDWYDEIYQNGVVQEYNLSVTGGGDKTSYSFSAGYLNEEGIIIYSDFERYSLRANTDAKVTDWLKIGQTLNVSFTVGKGNRGDNGEGTVVSQAYRMQPIIPVYDIMGNFAGTKAPTLGNGANPVAQQWRARNNRDKSYRALGGVYAEAKIIEGLNFKTQFGFDFRPQMGYSYGLSNQEFSEGTAIASFAEYGTFNQQYNWTNTLSYDKTFAGIHRISAIAGTEAISSRYDNFGGGSSSYFSEDPNYMTLSTGETNYTNYTNANEFAAFSVFGRVNYDLKSRYLVEATVRRDGSSRFTKENRWGVFPAGSVAWVISQEDFLANTKTWLSYLKLRLGWGLSGNDRIGEYQTYTSYGLSGNLSAYSIDGGNSSKTQGFQPSRYGNPDVTWETTETKNLGVDAQFFNNSLTFSVDVWTRNTTDMLYRISRPQVIGVATYPYVNIGNMFNKGYDIELGYKNDAFGGKFHYSISATASHYKNEIKKLGTDPKEIVDGYATRQMTYTRFTVGSAYPEFYGYTVDGIFQTQAEADAYPKAFGTTGTYNMPGHFKYRDTNGDKVITAADRTFIGSPHPKLTGGLNIDLSYTSFDMSLAFYGSYGNKMINYVRRWIDYSQFLGNRSKDRLYKSWGSPYLKNNADAKLAMADLDTGSEQPSTHFVEDGSFLRLKSLQLGFTMPKSIANKIGVQSMRIYGQATNLLTWTKYSGLDPELNIDTDATQMGFDQGSWPTPRQIMFGINLTM